jgi:dUTP pyrophosphatase
MSGDGTITLNFKKLNEKASAPIYGSDGSAGADLKACINKDIVLQPGKVSMIPISIAFEIPKGCFGLVCPRSGLASKYGITLRNSPGVIDSDFRGEMKVPLINNSKTPFTVKDGMRIVQLVIIPFKPANWTEVQELSKTARGSGGFGSTGLK